MGSNIFEGNNPGDKASSVTQLIQSTFPRLKKKHQMKKKIKIIKKTRKLASINLVSKLQEFLANFIVSKSV